MIKTIYFTGVIAGLLFPVIDDLLSRYSKVYCVADDKKWNNVAEYRKGPFHYKLIAALIPVINLMWPIAILLIIRLYIVWWIIALKLRFIALIARKPHKHYLIKVWIVKKLFKKDLQYFYMLCENAAFSREIKNLKSVLRMVEIIDKVAKEETIKNKQNEQQAKN